MSIDVLPSGVLEHRPRLTPVEMREQADEIRELMRSVLQEGVDFGRIPNTPKPTLFKSGAEWLLKWARMGHRKYEVHIERDTDGRPYGVTYRCEVWELANSDVLVATADGYCGYDEPDRETHTTRSGKAVPRAPWNTIIQMAAKRALVSATLNATAASGLFTQDVVAEDAPPTPVDPEQWFHDNGWADKAEHDAWRESRLAAVKAEGDESPEAKQAIKEWCEGNGLSWKSGVPKGLADAFDAFMVGLSAPSDAESTATEAAQGNLVYAPGEEPF